MMRIGVEVELTLLKNGSFYRVEDELLDFLRNELGDEVEREYYNHIIELKFFFQESGRGMVRRIKEKIKKLAQILGNEEGVEIPFKSFLYPISRGIIANGIHIHIDAKVFDETELNVDDLEAILVYHKFLKNPSIRFLFSHHIWGAVRYYSRDWKRKPRYRPLCYSPARDDKGETVEVRIYDLEDLNLLPSAVELIEMFLRSRIPPGVIYRARRLFKKLIFLDGEVLFAREEESGEERIKTLEVCATRLFKKSPRYRFVSGKFLHDTEVYSLTREEANQIYINHSILNKLKNMNVEVEACAV